MKIALVGNPNSGKTTLFNELTKLNQKTGNWGGVTVGLKSGKYFKDKQIEIIDLPGIYSLYPYSEDEAVTSKYLSEGGFDAIINIIDSTNLERNLSLTLQLLERKLPVVLALNMEDELAASGMVINIENIKRELRVDALLISALKGKNIDQLIEKAKQAKVQQETFKAFGANEEEKSTCRHKFIENKINLFRQKKSFRYSTITEKIDKIVTNKWLAYPIFAFVIWLMYFVSVQVVGNLSTDALEWFFNDFLGENIRITMENADVSFWLTGLVVNGIIGGIGAVLSFIPQIVTLFLFITFLEATGYMARVAFIMDKIFKQIGLSGKSFVPMIVGCGCSVPAIACTRTIEGIAERRQTIMLTPFIPCSAKLPVFALIAGALFPNNMFVAPSMYFLGIFMVILCGYIMNKIRTKKIGSQADTFIIEMPKYRIPKLKHLLIELWDKAKEFLLRAGTIILVASVVIWVLQSFTFGFAIAKTAEESILASLGKIIAPIFAPLGFGNWQSSVALIAGMFAKETVVSTFGVLFAANGAELSAILANLFTPQGAYAFMAFVLLSAPCVAAIGAIKKEMGSTKWMWAAIGFQTAVAYAVALLINLFGNLWSHNKGLCLTIIINAAILATLYFCLKYILKRKKQGGCAGCGGCSNKASCDNTKK